MCGIVGLFLKDGAGSQDLGRMFAPMLEAMAERGEDSAGAAIYRSRDCARARTTVYSADKEFDWTELFHDLNVKFQDDIGWQLTDSHCVLKPARNGYDLAKHVEEHWPELRVTSFGQSMEIYKETGCPRAFVRRFDISGMDGTHAIGHTRMATESAVTNEASHPFSTGPDLCLAHNGSLSNHNRLRDRLERTEALRFFTDCDTEVAAAYIGSRLTAGRKLEYALADCLDDLDGFYTFVVSTLNGFAVLRDPVACKPAVMAETADFAAFGSEYRALASLPGIETARIWEPEPGIVYSWTRQ